MNNSQNYILFSVVIVFRERNAKTQKEFAHETLKQRAANIFVASIKFYEMHIIINISYEIYRMVKLYATFYDIIT